MNDQRDIARSLTTRNDSGEHFLEGAAAASAKIAAAFM